MELPEIKLAMVIVQNETCAICGQEWEQPAFQPIPCAYVADTLKRDSEDWPHIVCDLCVEKYYPETFAEMMSLRLAHRPKNV